MATIEDVLDVLLNHERFVITTHLRPDGDAIGSQLALGLFLQALRKEVQLVNSDPPPDNLLWLPEIEQVETFEGNAEQHKRLSAADCIIVVDTNTINRVGRLGGGIKHSDAVKVLIDHHTEPETWFDITLSRDLASSTGELVYELITAYDPSLISEAIATALYAAILTDTGSFRYSSVSPAVHRIAGDLLERGDLSPEVIYTQLYETKSLFALRLLSRALDTVRLLHDGRLGYMVVSLRMLEETGAMHDDTEGLVSYILAVEGVQAALIFTETVSGTKVSFRSKGDVHVNEWARRFGGGGHRNASGAYVREPLDKTVDTVLAAGPQYLGFDEGPDDESLSRADQEYLSMMLKSRQ